MAHARNGDAAKVSMKKWKKRLLGSWTEWWGLSSVKRKLYTLSRWQRTEDGWDYGTIALEWHTSGLQALLILLSSHGKGRKPCSFCEEADLDTGMSWCNIWWGSLSVRLMSLTNTFPRTCSLCEYLECIIMLFCDGVYILYKVVLHVGWNWWTLEPSNFWSCCILRASGKCPALHIESVSVEHCGGLYLESYNLNIISELC